MRDLNKHKLVTRIIMYVNPLYEFLKIIRSVNGYLRIRICSDLYTKAMEHKPCKFKE